MVGKKVRAQILWSLAKRHILFVLLIPFVVATQLIILAPHLNYGFSDVDWGFLAFYKNYKTEYPDMFSNLINAFKHWGVYTHQSYYIGFQWEIFGLDFRKFQIVTHVFKILATLASYPVFYAISGSVLVAFLAVILFVFASPAAGAMYTVVTSSDYSALFLMSIFLWFYYYIANKNKTSLKWLMVTLAFLLLTLFLSTERMYPILFIIPAAELLLFLKHKSKNGLKIVAGRLMILYAPIILVFAAKPVLFIDFFVRNGGEIAGRISSGDWHVLLTPFISLGSLILPHTHWRYLGVANLTSFGEYVKYLFRPMVIFGLFTTLIRLVFKKAFRLSYKVLIFPLVLGILSYIVATYRVTHFDVAYIAPALIGSYLIGFSFFALKEWLKSGEQLLIGIFSGPIIAFVYIILTWIAAETFLIFTGVHRYLTVPAMAVSFFLASLITYSSKSLWSKGNFFSKSASLVPFFIIAPLVTIGIDQMHDFFKGHLFHGFGAVDQQNMRSQLNNYLGDLSTEKPSLFYFDYSQDPNNGYYYDNTLFGGFSTWMLFHEKINFNKDLEPTLLFQPPSGWGVLNESVVREKGVIKGFSLGSKYFETDNFYAFKLEDKKVINIKESTLNALK